jgi:hypothetical protein
VGYLLARYFLGGGEGTKKRGNKKILRQLKTTNLTMAAVQSIVTGQEE